ncbi:UNVERIFIED_CONTAM: hypothetical protein RMT77_018461 [Armadillidium vulgare]
MASGGQKKKDFYNRRRVTPSVLTSEMDDYNYPSGAGSIIPSQYDYDNFQSPPPLEVISPYSSIPASPPPLCPISELDPTSLESPPAFLEYQTNSYNYSPYHNSSFDADYGAAASYRPQGEMFDENSLDNYDSYNTLPSPGSDHQNIENNLSEASTSSGQHGSTPRKQKCSLCFNHGIVSEKKGHKWKCPYRDCNCDSCVITKGRQKTMKEQQKLTRDLIKMRLQQTK